MKIEKRDHIIAGAVNRLAYRLKTDIIKKEAWTWNILKKNFRYFDVEGREFKPLLMKNNDVAIKIIPPHSRIFSSKFYAEDTESYIITPKNIYRKCDNGILLKLFKDFFSERGYDIKYQQQKKHKIKKVPSNTIIVSEGGHISILDITKSNRHWEIKLRDKKAEEPHFCTIGHQYIFKIKTAIKIEEFPDLKNFILSYKESEISSVSLSPFSIIRRAIYGFHSPNLRAFYSSEGIFPEVQHAVKLHISATLAAAIMNASVFVRIAERLKGDTWYTLAAGILVFIRAPAEIYFMKKSLSITSSLPSVKLQEILDSAEIKVAHESKAFRNWRNFERVFYDMIKQRQDFAVLLDKYGLLKPAICDLVNNEQNGEIVLLLQENMGLSERETGRLKYFADNLTPIEIDKSVAVLSKGIERLSANKTIQPGSEKVLQKYIQEMFETNLLNNTINNSFKFLMDRIKQVGRNPSKEEISSLVAACRNSILPFRLYDMALFISLYIIGYSATFIVNLPGLVIPAYYIIYGASANIIIAAITRFGSQVGMQYLYRSLDNAPTITSAADTWNEYNSHLMGLWAVFSSLGLIIGLTGKFFSDMTQGMSRYLVEFIALLFFIYGFKEWARYYYKLERKSKTEE